METGDERVLFTGDTLFRDQCGRTDLLGGDALIMRQSLAKLAGLKGDYTIYPGHGDSTTLERERRFNPYVRTAMSSGNR